MYERIKGYYDKGLWSAGMVLQAVEKGLLSREQYRQIIGQEETGGADAEAAPVQDRGGGAVSGAEVAANG